MPGAGGRVRLSPGQRLVVISCDEWATDLHHRLNDYLKNGTDNRCVIDEEDVRQMSPTSGGTWRSCSVPVKLNETSGCFGGLW